MEVVWLELARQDLIHLRAYIGKDNPDAARRVALRLLRAVDTLKGSPAMGRPGRWPGTRELVVSGTPYIIPYRARGGIIEILRVMHTSRRWPDRP